MREYRGGATQSPVLLIRGKRIVMQLEDGDMMRLQALVSMIKVSRFIRSLYFLTLRKMKAFSNPKPGLMTSITLSLEVAVDSWTGTLNLRYLPHRIRHLSLTGRSVTVNLGELKYTSLKELNLQFVNISDIDLLALKGTNLEELSLSYNAAFDVASTQEILEKISDLRLRNETKLNSVAIGGTDRINFDEKKRKYRYEVRGGKQQPETPLLDNDASKRSQFSLERRATGSAPFLRRLTRLKP